MQSEIFKTDWFFDNPFEDNWEAVRDEWIENSDTFIERWSKTPERVLDYDKLKEKTGASNAYAKGAVTKYALCYDNQIIEGAEDLFPTLYENMRKIDRLYLLVISIFHPRSYLLPHHGDSSGILRCHCTLTVPEDADCKLFVQTGPDQIHEHIYKPGSQFYFDNTLYHWAGNPSKTTARANIFFDVWPDDTEIQYTGTYQEKHQRAIDSGTNLNMRKRITKGLNSED